MAAKTAASGRWVYQGGGRMGGGEFTLLSCDSCVGGGE